MPNMSHQGGSTMKPALTLLAMLSIAPLALPME